MLEISRAGVRRVGRKIGLTSPAVQRQMGVDTPDFGVLFADMAVGDGEPSPTHRLLQPRSRPRSRSCSNRDLPDRPVITSDVLRATDFVVAAIEIVDSRIKDWDISIVDTVARQRVVRACSCSAVHRGRSTDIDDLRGVRDDARRAMARSSAPGPARPASDTRSTPSSGWPTPSPSVAMPLRAGEVVLSGSLGPLVTVERGKTYEASIAGLGTVRADFDP